MPIVYHQLELCQGEAKKCYSNHRPLLVRPPYLMSQVNWPKDKQQKEREKTQLSLVFWILAYPGYLCKIWLSLTVSFLESHMSSPQ